MKPVVKILLIEDDPDDVQIFRDVLASWTKPAIDVELEVHRTYETAVTQLENGEFDLLITDYYLTGAFEDEGNRTALPLLDTVIHCGRHVPVVLWTSSSRLDVDPEVMKAVLNQQIRFLPKNRFNLGSLRYMLSALRAEAITILVVAQNGQEAANIEERIRLSEFYNFQTRTASSVDEARQLMSESAPPELCLLCSDGDDAELSELHQALESNGTTLLLVDPTCDVEHPETRIRSWSEQNQVPCLTVDTLDVTSLAEQLVHNRNRLSVRARPHQ